MNAKEKREYDIGRLLLFVLGRGASYQYFWCKLWSHGRWFYAGELPPEPPRWDAVYFPVHPTNIYRRGRSWIVDLTVINCLYAEFDQKHGWTFEGVSGMIPAPSAVISSGGGWHCYWFLNEPYQVNDQNREKVRDIQRRWVDYTGGDDQANDLARILRMPGTYNNKYPDGPRLVSFIDFNPFRLFALDELERYLPAAPVKIEPVKQAALYRVFTAAPTNNDMWAAINNPKIRLPAAEEIREIKARLSVRDLVPGPYYPEPNGTTSVHCVFPQNHAHGDQVHSAYINGNGDYFCKKCFGNKGKDAINLFGLLNYPNLSENDANFKARAELCERYGIYESV